MEISTPGRICLFGEHQDYLGLPVIAMGISLRARLTGEKRSDKRVIIHKPDLNEVEEFSLEDLTYTKPRDYFRSGIAVCKDEGLVFSNGFECEIQSNIPIAAGTSSSSAITVSWIHFLTKMADEPSLYDQKKIGEIAYRAEVLEFNEPGGMMDQYSTAIGNTIYLESEPEISVVALKPDLGTFVLGDSCEPKDTMKVLKRCRDLRFKIIKKIKRTDQDFSIGSFNGEVFPSILRQDEKKLLNGTIKNRDLLVKALSLLGSQNLDHRRLGKYLDEHHAVLRDILSISTPKIESMLVSAKNAGALGGKINGSGGGGCMFAYAPDDPGAVAEAIESVGGKAYIMSPGDGTKLSI